VSARVSEAGDWTQSAHRAIVETSQSDAPLDPFTRASAERDVGRGHRLGGFGDHWAEVGQRLHWDGQRRAEEIGQRPAIVLALCGTGQIREHSNLAPRTHALREAERRDGCWT
jgi:hypothetical protein